MKRILGVLGCGVLIGCTVDVSGGVKHTLQFLPDDKCLQCLPRCTVDGDYPICVTTNDVVCYSCEPACVASNEFACSHDAKSTNSNTYYGKVACFNSVGPGVLEMPSLCVSVTAAEE